MPHALHHSPRHFTPHYGLSPARQHRESSGERSGGFHATFRCARYARRASHSGHEVPPTVDASTCAQRASGVWSAAFTVLFVANLVSPAAGAIPRRNLVTDANEGNYLVPHRAEDRAFAPQTEAQANSTSTPDDVDIRLAERARFKTDYTLMDMLRIIAASRSPFEEFGASLSDAYEVFADAPVATETRKSVTRTGKLLDLSTSLIPQVHLSRVPGDISYVAARQIEGKPLLSDDMLMLMQVLDPRTWQGNVQMEVEVPGGAVSAADSPHVSIGSIPDSIADSIPGATKHTAPGLRDPAPVDARAPIADVPLRETHALPAGFIEGTPVFSPIGAFESPTAIAGEREHLAGYEQTIAADRSPPGDAPRVMMIDGHHYLSGDHGYYRVTKGTHENLWFVDAPRHDKAQVPVTLDPETGQWRADPPLRLCGGGCGQSKNLRRSDSIVDEWLSIASAISHLPELDTQDAIHGAFGNLSSLKLLRGNRADLRAARDYSIVSHRAALRKAMRNIDREAPLLQQQRETAAATAMHYSDNPHAEAFCQENAEILFHLLLEGGVPETRIRMITLTPQNRPSHVVVLYTEAPMLIDMLHLATPQPAMYNRPDGIGRRMFARAVFLTRDSTLILDPWGRAKATGFVEASTDLDIERQLDDLLATMGHGEGHPFTVSITRPLTGAPHGSRPRGSASASSASSPVSLSSEGNSVFNFPFWPDTPSSAEDAPAGGMPER
ncbi:hypothetical protein [Pandoraea sputorum]|uniref:Uncharacterized protein n=1 Tax=Pandoraea sputorum TaxID=93222 RepID=A0A5E5AQ02_9BURK|nr:hypothetical protein [Pandoraea sputorum]VVE74882.1 hypothetical protein PSP31121_00352 [Pandoraea sputorum]